MQRNRLFVLALVGALFCAPFLVPMECTSINDLNYIIEQLQPGDCLIVDVDDTLITPQAMMFRPQSPYHTFLDKIKKEKPQNLTDILSTWRLNRKVCLVEPQWPEILANLIKKGVTVLALTQVNTGKFGKIASMEKWRANELTKLNLIFSPFAVDEIETIIADGEPATLHKGILSTGSHTKAAVLEAFINKYPHPSKIVFIDDRLQQVECIFEFCKKLNIPYEGIHYLGASKLPYNPDLDLGHIQTKMIINQEWAEDEQISSKGN